MVFLVVVFPGAVTHFKEKMGFNMQSYGIQSMLKEGHKHLSGLDEAVIKNIDACKQLSTITRTSLGPNGNPQHSHFNIYSMMKTDF